MEGSITFEELIEVQYELQKSMGFPGTSDVPNFGKVNHVSEQGAKEMLLAAMVECSEALGEMSWKPWKPKGYKEVDKLKLTTELTDIIQFVANAAIYMGISADEMTEALRSKWVINDERVANGETTT